MSAPKAVAPVHIQNAMKGIVSTLESVKLNMAKNPEGALKAIVSLPESKNSGRYGFGNMGRAGGFVDNLDRMVKAAKEEGKLPSPGDLTRDLILFRKVRDGEPVTMGGGKKKKKKSPARKKSPGKKPKPKKKKSPAKKKKYTK